MLLPASKIDLVRSDSVSVVFLGRALRGPRYAARTPRRAWRRPRSPCHSGGKISRRQLSVTSHKNRLEMLGKKSGIITELSFESFSRTFHLSKFPWTILSTEAKIKV